MKEDFKKELIKILKKDKRIVTDNDELNITQLYEYVNKLDETLIELLLNEKPTREKFFLKIKDVYVFKQNDFKFFLDENKIDNSYTQYANRIGLTSGGKFLKDINDVVLDFPYKDCVLEGGQSTEEGTDIYFEYDEEENDYVEKRAKRKEIFFNQILAKDEIDRLTEPKAFTNIKRYTEKGEEKVKSFNRKNGIITDNLLIKGNNLLALHSLKEEFKGKVKLIYIDPPYNTGNDSFKYNDNFTHSTWLTFMKNRLEIAKELLKNDGIIFVHLDNTEESYLKVLLDNIFGRDKYINTIAVKSSTPSGTKTAHKDKTIIKQKDFILVYKKGNNIKLTPQYSAKFEWDNHYSRIIEKDDNNEYKLIPLINLLKEKKIIIGNKKLEDIDVNDSKFKKFYLENADKIVRLTSHKNKVITKKCLTEYKDKIYEHIDNNVSTLYINKQMIQPLSKSINKVIINRELKNDLSMLLCDFWDDIDFQNTQNEGGTSFPAGKKPELLLYRIIDMTTNINDIVLDFNLGSGTTAAVAHKMGRQYIGIEQLDYGENDSVIRLNNVINGDQSGISKLVNWKGGGSFVYLELAQNNQKAIEKINECKSLDELIVLFDELYEKYFLNYNVKVKDFKEKVVKEEEFKNLSLDRQKEIFARMLDLNQLYVNVSDMEDSQYKLSEEDIALTKDFYQIED